MCAKQSAMVTKKEKVKKKERKPTPRLFKIESDQSKESILQSRANFLRKRRSVLQAYLRRVIRSCEEATLD